MSDWLALAQILLGLVTVFIAWRALVAAQKSRSLEKPRVRHGASGISIGLSVCEGWLANSNACNVSVATEREKSERRRELGTLLPSLGSEKRLPKTTTLAHWEASLVGAEDLLDAARLEVDA